MYLLTVISPFLNLTVSTVIVFNNPVGLYSNPDFATFNGVLTNGNTASVPPLVNLFFLENWFIAVAIEFAWWNVASFACCTA